MSCRQVGMAQLCQDRRSPQCIRFLLRKRRGEFEQLERLLGLAERFSCSSRSDEGLALFARLTLCFVLLCGLLPLPQRVFICTALIRLRALHHDLVGRGAWSGGRGRHGRG